MTVLSSDFNDVDLAQMPQQNDDCHSPNLIQLEESTCGPQDSIFTTIGRIVGDIPQLDWQSFELGEPVIESTEPLSIL